MLIRARKTDVATDGRNAEGLALVWDSVSEVSDNGKDFYNESFIRASVNKTLAERGKVPLPLGFFHPWTEGSDGFNSPYSEMRLGDVRFQSSNEGLVFRARFDANEEASEILEGINSGELGDVSIGFNPYKSRDNNGTVVRTEIGLLELSVAPVGKALHKGAQVMSVRAAQESTLTKSIEQVDREIRLLKIYL